jgi:hypothetical protein
LLRQTCSKLYGFNTLLNFYRGLTPFSRIYLRF